MRQLYSRSEIVDLDEKMMKSFDFSWFEMTDFRILKNLSHCWELCNNRRDKSEFLRRKLEKQEISRIPVFDLLPYVRSKWEKKKIMRFSFAMEQFLWNWKSELGSTFAYKFYFQKCSYLLEKFVWEYVFYKKKSCTNLVCTAPFWKTMVVYFWDMCKNHFEKSSTHA